MFIRTGCKPEETKNESVKAKSLWKDAFSRLKRNKMACTGGIIVVLLITVAVFAPYLAPKDYAEGDFMSNYAAPGPDFPLGADFMGRDVLSRLIYGTRISLIVGFMGALNAFVIGVIYGMTSGFYGGKVDNIMMRIVDIFYAFPGLLLVILLMVVFKSNLFAVSHSNPLIQGLVRIDDALGGLFFIMIGVGFTSWVGMARLARGLTLSAREMEYVQAGRAVGASNARIMFKHVLPNILGPCIVSVTLSIPGYIGTEAFLSFIGLGVTPPTPSWGIMIAEGYSAMQSYPHLALYPGLALAITMLSFNFLGDGLRDALDPRMRQ